MEAPDQTAGCGATVRGQLAPGATTCDARQSLALASPPIDLASLKSIAKGTIEVVATATVIAALIDAPATVAGTIRTIKFLKEFAETSAGRHALLREALEAYRGAPQGSSGFQKAVLIAYRVISYVNRFTPFGGHR
jgi:hypothetical protein